MVRAILIYKYVLPFAMETGKMPETGDLTTLPATDAELMDIPTRSVDEFLAYYYHNLRPEDARALGRIIERIFRDWEKHSCNLMFREEPKQIAS